jgi:hypothetical protein
MKFIARGVRICWRRETDSNLRPPVRRRMRFEASPFDRSGPSLAAERRILRERDQGFESPPPPPAVSPSLSRSCCRGSRTPAFRARRCLRRRCCGCRPLDHADRSDTPRFPYCERDRRRESPAEAADSNRGLRDQRLDQFGRHFTGKHLGRCLKVDSRVQFRDVLM